MSITSQQLALLLHRLPKIGPLKTKQLIDLFNGRENILKVNKDNLLKIKGIGPSHWKEISQWEKHLSAVRKEEKFLQKANLQLFAYGDAHYPVTLQNTADPPTVFFQKGEVNWQNKRILGIVGTRMPTRQGIANCRRLIEEQHLTVQLLLVVLHVELIL